MMVVAGLLTGCATLQSDRLREDPGDLPPEARVTGVPFYAQKARYCGPASLAMMLSWAGEPVTQDAVAPQVFTPSRDGSFKADLLSAARRRGYLAVPVHGVPDLLAELADRRPVLVFQNRGLSWYPRWHFAVAIGYDLNAETIRLHSGTRKARAMPLDTFERTWARTGYWGMTVTPPGQLPATAEANTVLEAAVVLERSGHYRAAATAFEAAAGRWPGRLGAWIGLANNRYRLGDLEGAAAALDQALERHPRAADAWNNLAMIRAELGRQAEAVRAARRAVELAEQEGGAATYRQTLWQVRHADTPNGSGHSGQPSH